MKNVFAFVFFLAAICSAEAQNCTEPGQSPATAFPVCGTSVFTQKTVPLCGGRNLPSPHCANDPLSDVNPFYYKFTAFESGTLGFVITPKTIADDYDWELYDITGRDPEDIFTDGSLVVSSNWSGEGGATGASSAGTQLYVCAGFGKPLWSKMPNLQKGHNYLLLISHFTQSQSGYDLEFKGGSAVITDPLSPALKSATAACSGDVVRLSLNKKIRCNTIAADGSDFFITPANGAIISGSSVACSNQFDTEEIELRFDKGLAPGRYKLGMKKGGDNNTLLDFCDKAVAETDFVEFDVLPLAPTPMDSLVPVRCAPQNLQLIFKKPIACASIALDGSDFELQGPYSMAVVSAKGQCSANGTTTSILVELAGPMQTGGDFQLRLKRGADGNTLLDECSQETPAGSALSFRLKDTVSAAFTFTVGYSCATDTVRFRHPGGNGIDQWLWSLDDNLSSTAQNPTALYTVFDAKNIGLVVSNGFCSDTAFAPVVLDNLLTVDFTAFVEECPQEPVSFTSTAQGRIVQHQWSFGDGGTSTGASPAHSFQQPQQTMAYPVRYSVTDEFGCTKSVTKPITIYSSCTIYVPNAFSPNNDGRNDLFRPLNVVKVEQFEFRVYNRWGQPIFTTRNPAQGWDGTVRGMAQGTGAYIWTMRYTDRNTKKAFERKGSFVLIR